MDNNNSNNQGWISIHRKLLNWEWYQDNNVVRVFLHCILKANFEQKKWQGITINRGEFITSRERLAKELNIGIQQTRTALDKLKSTNEITIKTTNKYTVVIVNNYNQYQVNNQQNNKRITNKQPTNNQQVTTTNNNNNYNNNNKYNKNTILAKGTNINSIISLFEKINPLGYKRFFANKTERQSLLNVINAYGEQWTINLLTRLPEINAMPYAPQITSPYELEMKLGKLKIFLEQEKNKTQGKSLKVETIQI